MTDTETPIWPDAEASPLADFAEYATGTPDTSGDEAEDRPLGAGLFRGEGRPVDRGVVLPAQGGQDLVELARLAVELIWTAGFPRLPHRRVRRHRGGRPRGQSRRGAAGRRAITGLVI
ncbi:hypothetical protein, partial [Pseudonocardia sp.]|uniref:hypothetical protein n=1 Tax=Pseudonocardia sp. TaxID=60912 RepID=UPI00262910C4